MKQDARPGFVIGATASALLWPSIGLRVSAADSPLPASGEVTCEGAAPGRCTFSDPSIGLVFEWPSDWPVRRLRIVTETGPSARARQLDAARWIAFEYVPDDPAQPDVSLFQLAVLSRRDWISQSQRLRAAVLPVEVATGPDHVAVVSLPHTHPFPPGSRDADIFEALLPTAEQISLIVRFDAGTPGARPARRTVERVASTRGAGS